MNFKTNDFLDKLRLIKNDQPFLDISFKNKLKMNLKGFTADQYVRFNLEQNNINEYVSELERWKTRKINGRFNILLDDKLLFHEVFHRYINIPKNITWIIKGNYLDLKGSLLNRTEFLDIVKDQKKLILKPVVQGGSGKGVLLLTYRDGKILLDGKTILEKDVYEYLKIYDDYVVSEHVEQHYYSSNIFDQSVNTIRVVTAFENDGARLIDAVHRFGLKKTAPVDNASKGALVSKIDLKTGILGESKTFFEMESTSIHPDTRVDIAGVKIPNWNEVKKTLLETHGHFPYLKFVAWDVVITESGFAVIEGNASTGLNLFQLWEGIRNKRLGNFYKKQGIIK